MLNYFVYDDVVDHASSEMFYQKLFVRTAREADSLKRRADGYYREKFREVKFRMKGEPKAKYCDLKFMFEDEIPNYVEMKVLPRGISGHEPNGIDEDYDRMSRCEGGRRWLWRIVFTARKEWDEWYAQMASAYPRAKQIAVEELSLPDEKKAVVVLWEIEKESSPQGGE